MVVDPAGKGLQERCGAAGMYWPAFPAAAASGAAARVKSAACASIRVERRGSGPGLQPAVSRARFTSVPTGQALRGSTVSLQTPCQDAHRPLRASLSPSCCRPLLYPAKQKPVFPCLSSSPPQPHLQQPGSNQMPNYPNWLCCPNCHHCP